MVGTVVTVPVLFVYLAMGITYGVRATEHGLSMFNTVLMSIAVYAGTAQLVGAEMIGMGVPVASILVTTLVINSRFFVMASSLAPQFVAYRLWQRLAYGLQMTDASFAIHSARFATQRPGKVEIFTTNMVGHVVWVLATMVGILLGQVVDNLNAFAIDYAMPAMFIGLVVPLIRRRNQVIVALAAGAATLGFHAVGLAFWTILAATLVAVAVGFGIDRWTKAP